MSLGKWFAARGPRVVQQRADALLHRYGLSPTKAARRIEECRETLASVGCAPTFATPGIVVQRYPQFIRRLQDSGAEIAVHGYQHIDLSALPVPVAVQQLSRAVRTFEHSGIQVHGFRGPYLGCGDELRDALPDGLFDYSSNQAVYLGTPHPPLGVGPDNLAGNRSEFFETLCRFYRGKPFSDTVCLPSVCANGYSVPPATRVPPQAMAPGGLIEIPVCVPDDLQLNDGLRLGPEEIGQVWIQMLDQVYQRGELFSLLFHPELASVYGQSFVAVLQKARGLQPQVWIARLCDISDWWREKSRFAVVISPTPQDLQLSFTCSERATILAKGLSACGSEPTWDGACIRLTTTNLNVPAEPRPFIGLPTDTPEHILGFLREQGYILDTSETAARCGIYIDAATLARLTSKVKLIDHIEKSPGPLVRYGRWPNGAKSAMCISGDLDALSLLDYASRLFIR